MIIYLILGGIVILGIFLMLGRTKVEEQDDDDDDDDTPGGPRRIRVPVRSTNRGKR
jgi:hypothetical protein